MQDDATVAATILRLVTACGAAKSICPTDAARALANDPAQDAWRAHLGDVRRVAKLLARDGRIDILRKGRPIDPAAMHGVIRLRLRADTHSGEA